VAVAGVHAVIAARIGFSPKPAEWAHARLLITRQMV
jgi:hypothetical protein